MMGHGSLLIKTIIQGDIEGYMEKARPTGRITRTKSSRIRIKSTNEYLKELISYDTVRQAWRNATNSSSKIR